MVPTDPMALGPYFVAEMLKCLMRAYYDVEKRLFW